MSTQDYGDEMKPSTTSTSTRKPPFSQALLLPELSPQIDRPTSTANSNGVQPIPKPSAVRDVPPAVLRSGSNIMRLKDDPESYYTTELLTNRVNEIGDYLWLAGLPSSARALHRQQLLGRQIVITEDPNEHLVWHKDRMFIKPLPVFLFSLECWNKNLCQDKKLFEAARSLLLSYSWLVRYQSDLRIAHKEGLIPEGVTWGAWTQFIDDFLQHVELESLSEISVRFHYGELRLSRLNKIYRLTRLNWRDTLHRFMWLPTWHQDFFARNFAWLLAAFAFMSVVLSAMQVLLAISNEVQSIENVSYGFSVASLFIAAVSAVGILSLWGFLFMYHLIGTRINHQRVIRKRESFVRVKEGQKV